MLKSGLEKNILKSLHAGNYFALLHKRDDFCPKSQMEGFKIIFLSHISQSFLGQNDIFGYRFHFEGGNNVWITHILCVKNQYKNKMLFTCFLLETKTTYALASNSGEFVLT
jgi:hypothetical protein